MVIETELLETTDSSEEGFQGGIDSDEDQIEEFDPTVFDDLESNDL